LNENFVQYPVSLLTMLLICGFIFGSCASLTGTKTELEKTNLQGVKSLGVTVVEEEDFSVMLSRDKSTATGAYFGSFVGAAVESGIRSSKDKKLEEEFEPIVADIDLPAMMSERLRRYLEASGVFDSVEVIEVSQADSLPTNIDAYLKVTAKSWGLRLCPGSENKLQVAFGINSVLKKLDTGEIIWERDSSCYEGKCYTKEQFQNQEGLLMDAFETGIDNVSGRIANEICFP